MRHAQAYRKFTRSTSHRRAMFRNMATSLILHERFYTTVEKAKDLRKILEPIVTLGKDGSLHARRQAYSYLLNKEAVHKLFADIGPRFQKRAGGYLRIVRGLHRKGDAAEMAFIEFVDGPTKKAAASSEEKSAPAKKTTKKTAAAKSEKAASDTKSKKSKKEAKEK